MTTRNDCLQWPFFEDSHRRLAGQTREWATAWLAKAAHPADRHGRVFVLFSSRPVMGW